MFRAEDLAFIFPLERFRKEVEGAEVKDRPHLHFFPKPGNDCAFVVTEQDTLIGLFANEFNARRTVKAFEAGQVNKWRGVFEYDPDYVLRNALRPEAV